MRWDELPSLYDAAPDQPVYTTRIDDDAKMRVTFGDGVHGARLPTGTVNVAARYRSGIGPDGEVAAGAVTMLRAMPLGLRGVTNPIAASGAEAPEKLADARRNAPLTLLTFERVVSLLDYENYARAYPGIGKARGDVLWINGASRVHLTVAGATGGMPGADVLDHLRASIAGASDPSQRFTAASYAQRYFSLGAAIAVDPRYRFDDVQASVAATLLAAFGFDARDLGQSVTAAEIMALMHTLPGVIAVDIVELLPYSDGPQPADTGARRGARVRRALRCRNGDAGSGGAAADQSGQPHADGDEAMSLLMPERLYRLLPAFLRNRDIEQGEPLRALLAVIEGELERVESDISVLYDNWFIETCDEWVVPYIGDLLGVRPIRAVESAGVSARAYVANTIAYRRRKGTAVVLEQLARDTTGWPAHAVEFFMRLATTQHMNHVRLAPPATPGVRDAAIAALAYGPFDAFAHTLEVRNAATRGGRFNIPNVGIYLWRLRSYTVGAGDPGDESPDFASARNQGGWWCVHPVGCDSPLFNVQRTETTITHLAEEANVPGELRRLALNAELQRLRRGVDGAGSGVHDRGRSGAARVRATGRRERAGRGAPRGHLHLRDSGRRGTRIARAARARARSVARPVRFSGRARRGRSLGAEQLRIFRRHRRRALRSQRGRARDKPVVGDRRVPGRRRRRLLRCQCVAGGRVASSARRRHRDAVRFAPRCGSRVESPAARPHRRHRADGQPRPSATWPPAQPARSKSISASARSF